MIRKGNTTAIVQLAKDKSEKTRIRVEKTISEMALKEEKIAVFHLLVSLSEQLRIFLKCPRKKKQLIQDVFFFLKFL